MAPPDTIPDQVPSREDLLPAERSNGTLEYTADLGSLTSAVATLAHRVRLHGGPQRNHEIIYLDTFDWALSRAGLRLTQSGAELELSAQPAGTVVLRTSGDAVSRLAADLPEPLRGRLSAVLGVRALLPVARVGVAEVVLASRNADDKIVARLVVAAPQVAGAPKRPKQPLRLTVRTLRGYAKEARRLAGELGGIPGVTPAESSLFDDAVQANGRRVGDYTGKLNVALRPGQPAREATAAIYTSLLDTMAANVEGVLADLDTEFLHDFRVAVRRTRSALKELPGILPPRPEERFRREFKWLGDVTTPTRDLDVYLLTYPEFVTSVGGGAEDLGPLRQLLVREQRRASRELGRHLRSARYRRVSTEWARWQADPPPGTLGPQAEHSIGELADARIRRVGARVLRAGADIRDDSPSEALHDLRKRCKELRYLIEFFGTFYDREPTDGLVSALKGLQDNLGAFQDTAVQHAAVDQFAETLLTERATPAGTILALGRLGGVLERRQRQARAEFAERFAAFAAPANRRRLASLTSPSTDLASS